MSTATLDIPTEPMPKRPKPADDQTLAGRAIPNGVHRIVLTGFMGSGKTSTGTLLADRLGWRFLDLDHEIEARHHQTVPEIFANHGEAHFRHLESAALASLLGQRNVVIALGGGAPEELGNRLLLEQTPHTAVVYLSASFDTLVARCTRQAADPTATARPNLADLTTAERRFHLRQPHYQRIAAHTVDTADLTLAETTDAILTALQSKE
ncbi:MAG: shikimate kinase [Acidobacteriaceae bacterium]